MYPRGMLGTTLPREGRHLQTDIDSTYSPPLNVTREALQIAQQIAPVIAQEDDLRANMMRTSYHRASVPDYIPAYVPTDAESQKSSLSGASPFGNYLMKTAFGDKFAEVCSPSTKKGDKGAAPYYPW